MKKKNSKSWVINGIKDVYDQITLTVIQSIYGNPEIITLINDRPVMKGRGLAQKKGNKIPFQPGAAFWIRSNLHFWTNLESVDNLEISVDYKQT